MENTIQTYMQSINRKQGYMCVDKTKAALHFHMIRLLWRGMKPFVCLVQKK